MVAGNTSGGTSASRGRCYALIVAAGRGHRFGGDIPKQYLNLNGTSLLHRSISTFLAHPGIDGVRAVIHPDDEQLYAEAMGDLRIGPPVHGGAERQDSVRLGLQSMTDDAPDHVLIHDAVRPLVSTEVISRVIAGLNTYAAVIPGVAVADTLKRVKGDAVTETVPRDGLWRVQTPQGFRFAEILTAHEQMVGRALTDDAAVAEAAGLKVGLIAGDENNLKVTTDQDLHRAGQILGKNMRQNRVGSGFDVHRFTDGDHVMLCGINIPHHQSLEGHSDADVGLHALTDAILGAIGEGDIGLYFPPSDPQWKDAPSHIFLEHAATRMAELGGQIANLDLTLICEHPKIGPHRQAMRQNVANILGIDADRVNIKATTTERLGFTGRGEGIAGQAIASVEFN